MSDADHTWLPLQPMPPIRTGSMQGKELRILPMGLVPVADLILLSTGNQTGNLLVLAADSTSQGHMPMAVLHVH